MNAVLDDQLIDNVVNDFPSVRTLGVDSALAGYHGLPTRLQADFHPLLRWHLSKPGVLKYI